MGWSYLSVVKFYSRLSNIGLDAQTPPEMRKQVQLGNQINLTTCTLIIPYSCLFYALGIHKLAVLLIGVFFLFAFYHYLTYKRHYFISRVAMLLSTNVILGIYAVVLGRYACLHYLYFVFFTLPFLLFNLRHYILIGLCCVCSFVPFCVVRYQIIMPVVKMEQQSLEIISVAMTLLTFV